MKMPFYQLQHKQDLIRHFTPNWFTVVMGTGVVALILPSIAVAPQWMWSIRSRVVADQHRVVHIV